jgi:hypothetical protein
MYHENESSGNSCRISAELEHKGEIIRIKCDLTLESDERNNDYVQNVNVKWKFGDSNSRSWLDIPLEMISYKETSNYVELPLFAVQRMTKLGWYNTRKIQEVLTPHILTLLNETIEFFSGINYYSASQFSDPSRCPVSIELEENKVFRRSARMSTGHDRFILDLYKVYKAGGVEYKRYLNTVNKSGIELIDDISFTEVEMPSNAYEVKSGGKIKTIEKNRLLVVPSFLVDGINLSPNQLSEGTFKTLALLFYVLTDDSRLLLIEEPEVCIHHGLLNSIISLIKAQSKTKQIVISTHSDFVLDHLTPENIVLVKRANPKGTVAKPLTKTMSKNDYKALREYLDESGNLGEYWKEGGLDGEI